MNRASGWAIRSLNTSSMDLPNSTSPHTLTDPPMLPRHRQIKPGARVTASRRSSHIDRETIRLAAGKQRLWAVLRFNQLVATGMSYTRAAQEVRTPYQVLWRWRVRKSQLGFRGLLDSRLHNGRRSFRDRFGIDDSILGAIRNIAAQNRVDPLTAWQTFALSARCPRKLAAAILRGKPPLPRAFLRLPGDRQPQSVAA